MTQVTSGQDRSRSKPVRTGVRSFVRAQQRLLGERLYVHTWVRAASALALVIGAHLAVPLLGAKDLDVSALTMVAVAIAIYDFWSWQLCRRYRDSDQEELDPRPLVTATYIAVVLDYLTLTTVIWFVGGARSPLVAFYLLHLILSTFTLTRAGAIALVGTAYGLLTALVMLEWSGLAPPRMPEGLIVASGPLSGHAAATILLVYGTLFGVTTFLLLGLIQSLRRTEKRIRMANAEMSRISEQRRDFLRIAAHNLKAPVGAVSMLLENMQAELGGPVTEKQREWIARCLKRLKDLIEFMYSMEVLSSVESSIESDIIAAEFTGVDMTAVIASIVEEYHDIAEAKGHTLRVDVRRTVPKVVGYDRLLREAVVNFVTNAIKYTPEGGTITIRLGHRGSVVRVEVSDDGVGVAPEQQGRLFEEFVRIPNPGSPVAQEEGSGLGLSIVKRIVDAHGGRVGVESEPGVGSTFFIELPALKD